MIRVVLDTNVLVSALLSRHGAPATVFRLVTEDSEIRLCLSGQVYAEYDEVLRRPKLARSEFEIDGMLALARKSAVWVKPLEQARGCTDPDDDIFLECAQAARSHFLVTGNTRHFPAQWSETRVVTVRQFLNLIC